MNPEPEFTVSEFVGVFNQTLEYAYPSVTVTGELANFKVSKNRWIYFDLKDETATMRFFGNVYQLPGPLEDGMLLAVRGAPRLHPQFGFSVNVISMRPVGEGSIKKASELLKSELANEGLFDFERKRVLPYPPRHIGLITSAESAAYRDFIKILGERWGGVRISLIDVQVQGEAAPAQLVAAIEQFNESGEPPEILVVTRGGGSADDLQAFSAEQVVRAVAASRISTLVAIGHEIDVSLAEMAADRRGSTPSNAAELLVPDRRAVLLGLKQQRRELKQQTRSVLATAASELEFSRRLLHEQSGRVLEAAWLQIKLKRQLLSAFDPQAALKRGYALARVNGKLINSGREVKRGSELNLELADSHVLTTVNKVTMKTL
jgi:exodeoxyribonuclease VII large subunit